MKKIIFFLISLSVLTVLTSEARVYKGQKEYIKNCKKCHNNGQEIAHSKQISAWKKMMQNRGELLAKAHFENPKAKKSWKYFKSDRYNKKSRDLKDFFVEYAEDSGNIPACD